MKILNLIKKYRYEIKPNKTELYKFVDRHSQALTTAGFEFKIKDYRILFGYEVILKGLETQDAMKVCYDEFVFNNYDLLKHLNYQEKLNRFKAIQDEAISVYPSFIDQNSKQLIYLPYLEPFVNQYFIDDYFLLTLKQHIQYIKDYPKSFSKVIELYGIQPFNSDLSSLQLVGSDDDSMYFYHDDFKVIYQFHGNNIIDEIYLIDKYTKEYPSLELIKEAMVKLSSNEDEKEILEFLYTNKFIGDKTYKKIVKKLK